MLVFRSKDQFFIKSLGMWSFNVDNPKKCQDFSWLENQWVVIDEIKYKIYGVERYAHLPPFRKGEPISIVVYPPNNPNEPDLLPSEQSEVSKPDKSIENQSPQANP